jgi:seryl-tRNA synthetase
MLSIDYIRANSAKVDQAIKDKTVDLDLDELFEADLELKQLKQRYEAARSANNEITAMFAGATPEQRPELGRRAREAANDAKEANSQIATAEAKLRSLLLLVPNIPWDGAPVGPDESANVVVRREGAPPKFGFEPLDHVALIEKHDWADLSRITQVSGSRTYCLKGRLALLETRLMAGPWGKSRTRASLP